MTTAFWERFVSSIEPLLLQLPAVGGQERARFAPAGTSRT
jgi:hypothetical protein